jgi:hypothetical protein
MYVIGRNQAPIVGIKAEFSQELCINLHNYNHAD